MKTKIKTVKQGKRDMLVWRVVATALDGSVETIFFNRTQWHKIKKVVSANAKVTINSELMDRELFKEKFGENHWM